MFDPFVALSTSLQSQPKRWLLTGAAGFIGSNLLERLLRLNQEVVGLDNFVTGHQRNLDEVAQLVGPEAWARFRFHRGDLNDPGLLEELTQGVDYVLHQAALGSVPRSLADPIASHLSNVDGTLRLFWAAHQAKVKRVVYATSSSVYGDDARLPKVEGQEGQPLSPYALTKSIGEQYARVFARSYGLEAVGLRYFNVFGPRQDPNGPYAAVIPKWVAALVAGERTEIFGDGQTSRDFCFVENVIRANLLAATTPHIPAAPVYNVAVGEATSLLDLHAALRAGLESRLPNLQCQPPALSGFRPGDIRHSLANISAAQRDLGYRPSHTLAEGLDEALPWYLSPQAALVSGAQQARP